MTANDATTRQPTTAPRRTDRIPASRTAVIGHLGAGRWSPRYRATRGLR